MSVFEDLRRIQLQVDANYSYLFKLRPACLSIYFMINSLRLTLLIKQSDFDV